MGTDICAQEMNPTHAIKTMLSIPGALNRKLILPSVMQLIFFFLTRSCLLDFFAVCKRTGVCRVLSQPLKGSGAWSLTRLFTGGLIRETTCTGTETTRSRVSRSATSSPKKPSSSPTRFRKQAAPRPPDGNEWADLPGLGPPRPPTPFKSLGNLLKTSPTWSRSPHSASPKQGETERRAMSLNQGDKP